MSFLGILVGGVTFSGSLVAGAKLAGIIAGKPLTFPGARALNLILAVVALTSGVTCTAGYGGLPILCLLAAAALGLGCWPRCPSARRTCRWSSRC